MLSVERAFPSVGVNRGFGESEPGEKAGDRGHGRFVTPDRVDWYGHGRARRRRSRIDGKFMMCPKTSVPVLASLLVVGQGCSLLEPSPGAGVENVIVLSVDALTRRALSTYDPAANELPHLDRFSRGAVVFTNAFTSASWTLPAHASLFTGLYPDRHGLVRPGKKLAKDQKTLTTLLHERGFETVGFTGGEFLMGSFGFGKGFERYDGRTASRGWRPSLRLHQAGSEDGELFDRAVAYLRDVGRGDRPFFLFLHTYYVHDYYKSDESEELKECILGTKGCSPAVWDDLRERYDQRLRDFDDGFGRLLAAMEKTGLDESTLLIVLSDHGEGFEPERGRIHHAGRLQEDVIRIPLLVAGPHLSHRVVDENVSLVDVLPTVAELLGIPADESLDGVSFAKSLYRASSPRQSTQPRTLFAMEHAYRWQDGKRIGFRAADERATSVAVIHRNLYYIREGDREELYDIKADPEQERDLARGSLDLTPFRDAAKKRDGFEVGGEAMQIDRELEDRLRSLGYIR